MRTSLVLSSHSAPAAPTPSAWASHAVALTPDLPDWVQLLPAGTFTGRDGRGPYTVTDPVAVVAASRADALGRDLPIDYGHELDDAATAAGAPAAGWIVELAVREGATGGEIWGRVEWTEAGAARVRGREYRYLSPVFFHSKAGEVRSIARAALTNVPNLLLKSLSAREGQEIPSVTLLQRLIAALGLGADATEEMVVARCSALKGAESAHATNLKAIAAGLALAETATPDELVRAAQAARAVDPAKYVPVAQYNELAKSLQAAQQREGARVVDEAIKAGKLIPAQRDWARSYHAQNPEAFAQFVEKQPVIVAGGEGGQDGRPQSGDAQLDDEDKAVCAALGITPDSFKKNKES